MWLKLWGDEDKEPSVEEFFSDVAKDFFEREKLTNPLFQQNIQTSMSGGSKEVKRERMDLLPWEALMEVSRVYEFGTKKYSAHNWRKGYEWSKSIAALQRHFTLWVSGEDVDSETGESHLSSVVFHALALLTWTKEHKEFDDRYKKPLTRDFPPSTL